MDTVVEETIDMEHSTFDFSTDAIQRLEEDCGLAERNRKGIGFQVRAVCREETVILYFSGIPKKYEKAVTGLYRKNISAAFAFVKEFLKPVYVITNEEYASYSGIVEKQIHTCMEEFLTTMLEEGFEGFMERVIQQDNLLKYRYLLQKVCFDAKSKAWKLPSGELWTGEKWIDSEKRTRWKGMEALWKTALQDSIISDQDDFPTMANKVANGYAACRFYYHVIENLEYDVSNKVWKLPGGEFWNGKAWVLDGEEFPGKYRDPGMWEMLLD